MKKQLRALLHILFPKRDDAIIVSRLSRSSFANTQSKKGENSISLLPFSDAGVRACVHEVKFHKNSDAIALLGAVLHEHLTQTPPALIIPIPLSSERYKERGYNQVTLVAKNALAHTAHILDTDILYRKKHTVPQTSLSRSDRFKNMKNVFAVYEHTSVHTKIRGADIIILDDVTTTGATMHAAHKALETYKPKSITCVALAH